jgi:2-dehydro-3-deoxyphosphogluconate aldolase/(4S)-4-hydroxy-2-oxoglutarate aldolase
MNVIERMGEAGLIPVIAIGDAKDAVPLAKALNAGGLPVAEITFRTEAAEESIRRIAAEVPEMMVGAGTVLTVDQAKKAVAAGAKFIVAPGFNDTVVDYCIENDIPVTPGVNTASEIERALGRGLEVLKFFPSEASGGLKTIKALAGPYPTVKFYPTGGIGPDNIADYLCNEHVFACGGSWMAKPDLIAAKRFDEITQLCREAVKLVHSFEFTHLGINTPDKDEAAAGAAVFADLFSFPTREVPGSVFAGSMLEIYTSMGPGTHGHLAIRTNNLPRAVTYLRHKGIKTSGDTRMRNGRPVLVYLDTEIEGFAIHLLQR